jgi:hypothetical protein
MSPINFENIGCVVATEENVNFRIKFQIWVVAAVKLGSYLINLNFSTNIEVSCNNDQPGK